MKKLTCVLLLLAFAVSLAACGKQETVQTPPEEAEKVPVLCMTLEESRLYAQAVDGSEPVLLEDQTAYTMARRDNMVLAAFSDDTVRKIDLTSGESSTVLTLDFIPSGLYWCDSGFVYTKDTMAESRCYYYSDKTGKVSEVEDWYGYVMHVSGDTLYYLAYDPMAEEEMLVSLDLPTQTEKWRRTSDGVSLDYRFDLIGSSWNWEGEVGRRCWWKIDPADGAMTELAMPFDTSRYDLLYIGSGGYLVCDREGETDTAFFASPEGELTPLELEQPQWGNIYVEDAEGDTVLLHVSGSVETSLMEEDYYYFRNWYYLLNAATGEVTPLTGIGREAKLFQEGDFPVLDSSTARKPVTKDIYRFFCLQNGIGGAQPVCNTTHGAWLALADGTTDIALLAAPTEEEQAYLAEKGVSVESKLYGGDGLVFIGNRASGVENLTLEQLRAIYRGEITNWAELGGADHAIRVLYRDDQSGSQRLFERMVWAEEEVPDFEALGFEQLSEMNTIVGECLYDPYCIGYSIMTYLRDVFQEEELQSFSLEGFAATPENVAAGTYPLGTKGYVVIRSDEPEGSPARRLYQWFGSPVCNDILTGNGITPLSE